MFDTIKCKYPLPDPQLQDCDFQTKSLENLMDRYTITADGKLVWHMCKLVDVPEEERTAYAEYGNTPEWDTWKWIGSMRSVPVEDRILDDYHGDIYFGMFDPDKQKNGVHEWVEYQARFTDGQLQWIKRLENSQ